MKIEKMYSLNEAADILGVSRQTLYYKEKKGELKFKTVMGHKKVTESEINRIFGVRMTNRESIAWALNNTEFSDEYIASLISDMLEAIGLEELCSYDQSVLAEWMQLHCDADNNWGKFPEVEE